MTSFAADRMQWEPFKARLSAALDAMQRVGQIRDPETSREILERRARALARASRTPEHDIEDTTLEIMSFTLGGERYGLDTRFVHGIERTVSCTILPGAPKPFVGVANVRGAIVAVVDVSTLLNVRRAGPSVAERIIVVGAEEVELAILVDSVEEVLRIPVSNLRPMSETAGGLYIRAISDESVIVLDGSAFIDDPRLFLG